MARKAIIFAFAFLFAQSALAEKRYYSMPESVFQLLPKMVQPIKSENGMHLVQLSEYQVIRLSSAVHHTHGGCGGFEDVSSEVAEKSAMAFQFVPAVLPSNFVGSNFEARPLRHVESAKAMLEFLKPDRFETTWKQYIQFPNRYSRSEEGKKAAFWLRDTMLASAKAAGRDDITAEMVHSGWRYKQDSVLVKIPGTNSSEGILIGGHMDTLRGNMPGADDDASGTMTVMEIFRSILDSGVRFKNDIYFAFYAAEEVGLVGSKIMAQQFRDRGIRLQAVLQYDMTGYRSSRDDKEIYFVSDNVNEELSEFTRGIAQTVLGIPKSSMGKTFCRYACSDHASWHRQGYPAVFPFESSFRNSNKAIHTSRDTMARLDLNHAFKFVRLGMATITELAEPATNL